MEKSKTQAMLEKNKILEAWPQKAGAYCLSVTPAVEIERLKFSFFPKGQQGKNGFDIYVDGLIFYQLINDLKKTACVLKTKWEYTTGKNGSKKLSIENGQKAYVVVHGADTQKKLFATVGLNRDQVWGLINLYDMFIRPAFIELWKTSYDIGKKGYRKDELTQDDEVSNSTVEETPTEPAPATSIPAPTQAEIQFTSANELTERDNGLFTLMCQDAGGEDIQVVFDTAKIDTNLFDKFSQRLKDKGSINFTGKGQLVDKNGHKRLFFESF